MTPTEVTAARAVLRNGVFVAAAAVPEPGTWLLTIAGVGILGATLRRRSRVDAALMPN